MWFSKMLLIFYIFITYLLSHCLCQIQTLMFCYSRFLHLRLGNMSIVHNRKVYSATHLHRIYIVLTHICFLNSHIL